MACKTISVLGAATQQVAIPSRLPQTQSDWQTFTQQLNTLFSQLSTTARRPAATSVPIQYATLFSSTLPPLQTTNCTVTADNSWSLFGGYSYKIAVTGSNASVVCGASGFPLPIPPNENWLLSVYGKCSGASQSFKMGLQTATTTYENTVITDATATTVDRFAIPLNLVADDASQCTLRLDFPSASGQTFWFDGFQYEPSVTGSINPSPFLSTNIIAGSIVAQFITVAQLSALSANMGTLTAGKIQSSDGRFTIDCTNELITITDGTNTRMQIGEVSAGVYDVKIWNGSGTLLFDAATGLQYAGNSTQITQVINNNSGNGQLNVNPTGGVTSNLPHANQSNQTLQVIANVGGNGQLNVNPTGGVTSTLPYANHAPSITTTIVNTPDTNGSYLGHGVVFQPHIHANQIGWGHFIGDTSGDYVGNIADTTAKRFLHGAMSTGVQGVISSGSQVNVNPSGGVTGNLPYANHDVSVRTTLASTAGGDGSYLNPSQVFNRHLNSATQDGLADGATYGRTNLTNLTGGNVDLAKSVANKYKSNLTGVVTDNLVANGNFVEGLNGWNFPPGWVQNNPNGFPAGPYTAQINPTSVQNTVTGWVKIPIDPSKTYLLECYVYCNTATATHYIGFTEYDYTGTAVNHSGSATYGYALLSGTGFSGIKYFSAEVTGNGGTSPSSTQFNQNTASIVPLLLVNYNSTASISFEINMFRISEVAAGSRRGLQSTTAGSGNYKAYADFTDNTANGHIGKHLGNIPDDSGSSRYAVAAVDPNKKALIDYSQPGHTNANLQYFGGIQSGYCYDGQAITFNPVYSSIPLVFFPANGMTYSSGVGSATSQSLAFTASSLTTSGFTASLKLVTGGTLTARSDNFSAVVAGSEYNATLTNAPAYNNQYTVNWTLSLGSSSAGTVEIRETNSTGTLLSSHNYLSGQNGAKATGVTWSGATGTSVIDISLTVTQGTGTISASTVTFTSGTAPSTNSAVPSTAPILWIALPQT